MYTNGQRLYTLSGRVFARGQVLRVVLGGAGRAGGLSGQAPGGGRGGVRVVVTAVAAPAPATALPIALPATQSGTITPLPASPTANVVHRPSAGGNCSHRAPGTRPPPRVAALVGPAPTGLRVFVATPRSASLGWTAVSGATGYTINRAPAGTTTWTRLTPSPIARRALTETYFPRPAPGPHTPIRSLRISLTAESGPPRWNSRRRRRAIRPVSPPGWRSGSSRAHLDKLCRCDASRRGRLSPGGPGIPQGTKVHDWDPQRDTYGRYVVTGLPGGLHEYRIATVYSPGGVLTPLRVGRRRQCEWRRYAVPLLSRERCRDSGRVQPAHLQRRQVARHPDGLHQRLVREFSPTAFTPRPSHSRCCRSSIFTKRSLGSMMGGGQTSSTELLP